MNVNDKIVLTSAEAIDFGAEGLEVEQLKDSRWVAPIIARQNYAALSNAPVLPEEEVRLLRKDAPINKPGEYQPQAPVVTDNDDAQPRLFEEPKVE